MRNSFADHPNGVIRRDGLVAYGSTDVTAETSNGLPNPKYQERNIAMSTQPSVVEEEGIPLIVEDGLIKIVRISLICEFNAFSLQLSAAKEQGEPREIRLNERVSDVKAMIEVLHAPVYGKENAEGFTVNTLVATLILATKYDHPSLRAYAIHMLEPREREISPARRIELSQTYGIPGWVRGAVDELGWRREPISPEEANMLGSDMSDTVSRLRERAYNDASVDLHPFVLYPVLLLCALPILSALLQGTVYNLIAAKDLIGYMAVKIWSRLPEIIVFLNPPLILIALVRSNRGMDKPVDSDGVVRTRPALLDAVILLCMLPGVKILVNVLMLANKYVGDKITKTLWFLLHYVTPLLSLALLVTFLLELAYFYRPGGRFGNLIARVTACVLPTLQRGEPYLIPRPHQCPQCKFRIGADSTYHSGWGCARCKGGVTLNNS